MKAHLQVKKKALENKVLSQEALQRGMRHLQIKKVIDPVTKRKIRQNAYFDTFYQETFPQWIKQLLTSHQVNALLHFYYDLVVKKASEGLAGIPIKYLGTAVFFKHPYAKEVCYPNKRTGKPKTVKKGEYVARFKIIHSNYLYTRLSFHPILKWKVLARQLLKEGKLYIERGGHVNSLTRIRALENRKFYQYAKLFQTFRKV
jgi:hypothetical protein